MSCSKASDIATLAKIKGGGDNLLAGRVAVSHCFCQDLFSLLLWELSIKPAPIPWAEWEFRYLMSMSGYGQAYRIELGFKHTDRTECCALTA